MTSAIERVSKFDHSRNSFFGEHFLVLGVGIALLFYARRRSPLVKSVLTAAGTGLIARAASGRDGIGPALRRIKR